MAGAANSVDRCVISRFITCSRAVYSVMMQRTISSPYALGVTDKRICDSWVQLCRTHTGRQRLRKARTMIAVPASDIPIARMNAIRIDTIPESDGNSLIPPYGRLVRKRQLGAFNLAYLPIFDLEKFSELNAERPFCGRRHVDFPDARNVRR